MDFTCSRTDLSKGLKLAEGLVCTQSAIPSLQGIFLETNKNILTIRSTDLTTGFEMFFETNVKKEGRAVMPVHPTIQLVASISGETVHVEAENTLVHFTTHATTSSVKGYPNNDFPKLPKIQKENTLSFSIPDFLKAARSVLFAASKSDIRPEIASIYVKGQAGGDIKIVATDSFRLAECSFKGIAAKPFSFLFPGKRLGEFVRILESFTGTTDCFFDGQQFFASHEKFSYFTRLTEGKFPDYEQIIPRSFTTEATINRLELLENLKLAGIFSGQLREIRLKTYPTDGLFEILTKDSEVGEHSSHLKALITGEGVEMAFNQRFVIEGIDPISSENVLLRFSGAGRPLVIQNPQDVSYMYLAMPMKSA